MDEGNKNTATLAIIALIAIAGLGLGGYSFYQLQTEGQLQVILIPLESSIAAGVWTDLNTTIFSPYNSTDWLVGAHSSQILRSNFVSLSNNNTRFTIQQAGWYIVQLSLALVNLTANEEYNIDFKRNNATEFHLDKFNSTGPDYYLANIQRFVYFNSSDYFEINCKSNTSFNIGITGLYKAYNQLSLEYKFFLLP